MIGRFTINKKIRNKADVSSRLYLCLLDGEEHKISEFYDFLTIGVDPVRAIRQYQQIYKYSDSLLEVSYEEMLKSGKRMRVIDCLWRIEKRGFIQVEKVKECNSIKLDLNNYKVKLTEAGFEYIFTNYKGSFTRIASELYHNLKNDILGICVKYLGKPELQENDN